MIPDKIALLMEETGCDQGEAELALEMCGYVVEEAVKAIPRMHKNIVVFKGRLVQPEQNLFGLLLVILNVKSRAVLRTRAVLSYNPAVCSASLDKDWFEFEKCLYGCRLWDGSLPTESLEIEQAVAGHLRANAGLFEEQSAGAEKVQAELSGVLRRVLHSGRLELKLKKDVLDLGQYHAVRAAPSGDRRRSRASAPQPQTDELLILRIALDSDEAGMPAAELRAGDIVAARIADSRDIAKYLAKLFGGHSEQGSVPIPAPVEAIESAPMPSGGQTLLVRVRFSAGVCGDAEVPAQSRLRAARRAPGIPEKSSWWQRFFGSDK
ncbi:MAG: hypothetical protein A3J82_09795 [Elusimicrobia bacterium RIFOXYA2_FULL_69_6]|nr:MAG: hypothetical protein A3J82_09795 [Elusimicrobia bacterium RIFOXYA2_FULL_69_6]